MAKEKKNKEPDWILGEHHGVSVDNYCWHLWFRAYDEDGNPCHWQRRRKYYASFGQLLESLQRIIERDIEKGTDILPWVEQSYDTVLAASEAFIKELKAQGVYEIKRPSTS